MTLLRRPWRRLVRTLVPVVGILLAISTLAIAVHHHDGAARHDHCAVCTAGHAQAISTGTVRAPAAPALRSTRLALPACPAPPCPVATTSRGRAPPTA